MPDNFLATDAQGSYLTFRSTESGGIHTPHRIIESVLNPIQITGPVVLGAGSAIVGAVDFNTGLLAGTEHIGSVTIDTSLPAGANTIGTVLYGNSSNTTATGTLTALNNTVEISCEGAGMVGVDLTGTSVQTVVFEATVDNTNWFPVNALGSAGTSIASISAFPSRAAFLMPAGYRKVRVRTSAFTSGSVTATLTANSATNVVTLGTSGATIGNVGIVAGSALMGLVNLAPRTTGGCLMHHVVSAASNNAAVIKGSAGQIYSVHATNHTASWKFVKFYNKATAPTVGTDTPVMVLGVPPNGFAEMEEVHGAACAAGIGIAIVTGAANSDNTAVALNDVIVSTRYT